MTLRQLMTNDVLIVGDIHLTDHPPSSCTDSYTDDLFDLLRQTVELAENRQVAAVIWAGDVFHHKAPSKTSHKLVLRTIELVKSYPCPLYIVPGNHDLSGDRLESLDKQPLGVLFEAGAIDLSNTVLTLDEDTGSSVWGIPWLQDWAGLRQRLVGWRIADGWRANSLIVTHCSIFPPGGEPVYEHVLAATWAAEMGGEGNLYYGHIHENHGTYSVGGVTFSNQGALSRGSLHEYNLTREVAVTLWNPSAGFRKVVLDYKPASEVFRLTEAAEVKAAAVSLDAFLEEIGRTTVAVVSIESVLTELRGRNLAPELLALVTELLESS